MFSARVKTFFTALLFAFACFFTPLHIALAQAYVPVIDINMQNLFPQYTQDLFQRWDTTFGAQAPNGNTDSLRDLISGANPQGLAAEECAKKDNAQDAYSYPNGNWARAVASSSQLGVGTDMTNTVPEDPNATPGNPNPQRVQINASASLRCLLQEVVEWQKLQVSVQIHALLKTYIADAQTKQLNNQLMNRIAAANLDWAKAGNQVNDNGVLSNEAVYSTNVSQSTYNKNSRQLEHITDQAAADPASGNPVGSLGIPAAWRLDTAASMVQNNRSGVEDPFNYTQSITEYKGDPTLDANDWGKFTDNFNDPANKEGGFATWMSITNNPANTPLGAMSLADAAARGRIERQQETTKQEAANSGFTPTKACSGRADDPYCVDQQNSTAISPANQNAQTVTDMAKQGNTQVQQGDTLDGTAANAAESQSTVLNTQTGTYGYDATGIQNAPTAVNNLVTEFYDAIQYGYFGVSGDTTEWAQGTMLMIYDEMKFDDANPDVVVTRGQAAVDTGY